MRVGVSAIFLFIVLSALNHLAPAQRSSPTPSGPLIRLLETPDRVHDVEYSADGKLLAAGFGWNNQGGVRIWRTSDHKVVANIKLGDGDDGNVEHVSFSNDGKLLAAATWNGDVFVWKVDSWAERKKVISNKEKAKSLTFSPDSRSLLLTTEDLVLVHDVATAKQRTLVRKDGNSFVNATFSTDGRSVIVFEDGLIGTVNFADGREIKRVAPANASFFGTISKDGQSLISGGGAIYGSKSVEVRRTSDGKKLSEISAFRGGLFAIAASPSGDKFAVAGGHYGDGGDIGLWSTDPTREIGYVSFGEMPIQALSFSPDEKVLAAGSDDGYVLLYAVDFLKGPEVEKQTYALCGEIVPEHGKLFMVPLSKVPGVHSGDFQYSWKLEIANPNELRTLGSVPAALDEWALEKSSVKDKIRVGQFRIVGPVLSERSDYIVFGDIQNPGWNEGALTKIYSDGTYLTTDNPGRCVAKGNISQMGADYAEVKKRLIHRGILNVPKEPLTANTPHFRTNFVVLTVNGKEELRSDAEDVEVLLKDGPAKKREAFWKIISPEETLIKSLRVNPAP